jgi:hypothetical protein
MKKRPVYFQVKAEASEFLGPWFLLSERYRFVSFERLQS